MKRTARPTRSLDLAIQASKLCWGACCLVVLWILAACGSPTASPTEAVATDAARATGTDQAPTATEAPQAVEEMLLHRIAERICPYPDEPDQMDVYERYFTTHERATSFTCYPATGHSIRVLIRRFADPAEALSEFEAARAPGPAQEFQGFPVSDWGEQHPSFPDGREEYRVRLLQVGPWLIEVRSFDDTHFVIAPDPREASTAILQVVQEQGLPATGDETP